VNESAIVAVLADGCSGTHPTLETGCQSSNEVGAKLLTYTVTRAAIKLGLSGGQLSASQIVQKLSATIHRTMSSVVRNFAGRDRLAQELFTFDFLMATVLGFIVTDKRFVIFHCGDGSIGLNGSIYKLDDDCGKYISNNFLPVELLREREFPLKVFAEGSSSELASIFLATDGMNPIVERYPMHLEALINSAPTKKQVHSGFDYLLQEFRGRIAWNEELDIKLEDDATFALLRRTDWEPTDHDHADEFRY
jgi:hypothetical protein